MATAFNAQSITRAGLTPSMAGVAATTGDTTPVGENVFLVVKTAGTGTTVAILTPGKVEGEEIADTTVVLGATAEKWIGPITSFYADNTTSPPGRAKLTFTSTATVSVGVFTL